MSIRKPLQVAKRAIILGAISFRASLELTVHPRVVELSLQLLPWLHKVGIADELDPIERELLGTPFGKLSESQKTDANWAGESASLFCWALNMTGPLEVAVPADASMLPGMLRVLYPEASTILQSASLREIADLEAACKQFVLVRSALQETRIAAAASDIIRRIHSQRLAEVGIDLSDDDLARASDTVSLMSPDERHRAAGLYFIRDHAALCLFSSRPSYFEPVDETFNEDHE